MEVDVSILFLITVIIAFGLAIISLINSSNRALRRDLGEKIDDLPDRILEKMLANLPRVLRTFKEIFSQNPGNKSDNNLGNNPGKNPSNDPDNNSNNERKNELLEKLDKKEINYDECVELAKMLKKEIDEATKRGDILTVILTTGVIIYVGIVLKELSKGGSSSQTSQQSPRSED